VQQQKTQHLITTLTQPNQTLNMRFTFIATTVLAAGVANAQIESLLSSALGNIPGVSSIAGQVSSALNAGPSALSSAQSAAASGLSSAVAGASSRLSSAASSAAGVESSAAGRLDIVGYGTDKQMYHKAWVSGRWSPSTAGWEALGGTFVNT